MWLVLPIFNGAAYIYENYVRKYVKIGWAVSPNYTNGHRKVLQMMSLDARKSVERYIERYGLFPMTLWILPNRITILITLLTVIIIVIILGIVIFIRRWRGIKTCSIHGPPYNLLNLILIFKINVIDDTQTISRKFTNVPRSIARGIDICR
uniref:Uncharacterized protein n=1 Tax=Opuntia streptacantha TaxID=393608 RepID=A0A7C9EB62_OPUST